MFEKSIIEAAVSHCLSGETILRGALKSFGQDAEDELADLLVQVISDYNEAAVPRKSNGVYDEEVIGARALREIGVTLGSDVLGAFEHRKSAPLHLPLYEYQDFGVRLFEELTAQGLLPLPGHYNMVGLLMFCYSFEQYTETPSTM